MAIQRYKPKGGIIEAVQYDGTNLYEIQAWCPFAQKSGDNVLLNYPPGSAVTDVLIKPNDYIVRTSEEHFSPYRVQDHEYVPFEDVWVSLPISTEPSVTHYE